LSCTNTIQVTVAELTNQLFSLFSAHARGVQRRPARPGGGQRLLRTVHL